MSPPLLRWPQGAQKTRHSRHCLRVASPMYLRLIALVILQAGVLMPCPAARAFDDRDFCSAAKQFAIAAEQDVGHWLDRVTRNGGMSIWCDRKMVEFKRFTYAPSVSMTNDWKARKAAEWNTAQCGSALWGEAIRQGWKVDLSVTAADGGRAAFSAKC